MSEFFKMSKEWVCRRAGMTDEEQAGEWLGHQDRRIDDVLDKESKQRASLGRKSCLLPTGKPRGVSGASAV